MHLPTTAPILLLLAAAAVGRSRAQTRPYSAAGGPVPTLASPSADDGTAGDNAADYWCGRWAGSPEPADVPTGQQLPVTDFTRRFFVEPQLQRTPFAPVVATEPKVQIPKIWGNSTFVVIINLQILFIHSPPPLCFFFLVMVFVLALPHFRCTGTCYYFGLLLLAAGWIEFADGMLLWLW